MIKPTKLFGTGYSSLDYPLIGYPVIADLSFY